MDPNLRAELIKHDLGHRYEEFENLGIKTFKEMAHVRKSDLYEEILFNYAEVRNFDRLRATCIQKIQEQQIFQQEPLTEARHQKIEKIFTETGYEIKSEPKYEYIPEPTIISSIKVKGVEEANGLKPLDNSYLSKKRVPSTSGQLTDVMELELYYPLNNKSKGVGLIFINTTFKFQTGEVPVNDKENFISIFQLMGLKIFVHEENTYKEIQAAIQEIVDLDFAQYGILAVAISTHGDESDLLYARDGTYSLYHDVVSPFKPNNCLGLTGKPKVFLIQSCRGNEVGKCPIQADGIERPCVTHESDFLIAHSTVWGYKSFRHTETGSWFVTTLREIFKKCEDKYNLVDILTFVNQIVIRKSLEESVNSD